MRAKGLPSRAKGFIRWGEGFIRRAKGFIRWGEGLPSPGHRFPRGAMGTKRPRIEPPDAAMAFMRRVAGIHEASERAVERDVRPLVACDPTDP